ncbi:MAG: hypothetical protein ACK5BV_04995 [Bacteroidota bacterium]|jgi:hypothetical protein
MKKILTVLTLFLSIQCVSGQKDTLPDFSVKNINGQIIISWHNLFKNTIQVNIQRSKESNRSFITIHSSPDPKARHYKYIDKTAPHDSCYYRIFILFEGTNYQFSKVLQPVKTNEINISTVVEVIDNSSDKKTISVPEKKESKEIIIQIPVEKKQESETNSPAKEIIPTRKKSSIISEEIILEYKTHNYTIRPKNNLLKFKISSPPIIKNKKTWAASPYIFTGNDGNVTIQLPDVKTKKYSITFLKEEGRPLFVLSTITESPMIIDKSSFLRSGWYYFELREDEQVLERNKFLLTKDF